MTSALERLRAGYYNSDPVSEVNPGGFGDGGHVVNFPAALDDLAAVADAVVVDAVAIGQVGAKAQEAAASAETAEGAAEQTAADRAAIAEAMPALSAAIEAAEQTALDRAAATAAVAATATDRQAVADAMPSFDAAVTAAQTATDKAGEALAHAEDAEAALAAAVAARNETKQLRDQAANIVGGEFLDEAAADARYRKLADLLNIADVDGLTEALASKATQADVTAAIAGLVGAAPAALDTIYELAAWAQDKGDALAALTLLVAGKASQADLTALTTAVAGKASQAALDALAATVGALNVPSKGTVAQFLAGSDNTHFLTAETALQAGKEKALVDASTVALDMATGRYFSLLATAGVGSTRTIGAPTNLAEGQTGTIRYQQDATGNRALAFHSSIKLPTGGVSVGLAANAITDIPYRVVPGPVMRLYPPAQWAS